ncbi:hypothetical protein V3C99_006671 [Haemonchus contortus]
MRRSELPLLFVLFVTIVCLLSLLRSGSITQHSQIWQKEPDPRVKSQFYQWKQCIEKNISSIEEDAKQLWGNFWKAVQLCEKLPFMADLKIKDFHNGDEIKRHIPSLQQKPSIIVTLGIGQDTAAERALIKELPRESLFYGADPMQEINEELYSKFGTYFPIAVGSESKIFKANVLINDSYVDRNVIHIEFIYFLTQLVGHKVYDDIWIDAEGAEYEMFPYFYRGGALDQNGITLCQFNLEVNQQESLIRYDSRLWRQRIFSTQAVEPWPLKKTIASKR